MEENIKLYIKFERASLNCMNICEYDDGVMNFCEERYVIN